MNRTIRTALLVIAGASAVFFAAERARAREVDQFEIVTGFSAKETCSCAFVVEQTDEYCQAFGKIGPFPVTIAIDHKEKAVTSSYSGTARTAHFSEGAGCENDALP